MSTSSSWRRREQRVLMSTFPTIGDNRCKFSRPYLFIIAPRFWHVQNRSQSLRLRKTGMPTCFGYLADPSGRATSRVTSTKISPAVNPTCVLSLACSSPRTQPNAVFTKRRWAYRATFVGFIGSPRFHMQICSFCCLGSIVGALFNIFLSSPLTSYGVTFPGLIQRFRDLFPLSAIAIACHPAYLSILLLRRHLIHCQPSSSFVEYRIQRTISTSAISLESSHPP